MHGGGRVERLIRDLRYAVRSLRKSPGFTITVIVVLGLGIAACVIVFSAVNTVLLQPLPFARPERLAFVWSSDSLRPETRLLVSWPDYLDWRARTRAFDDLVAIRFESQNLRREGGSSIRVATIAATPNASSLLGMTPAAGRLLIPADGDPGAPAVIVMSHGFWVRAFGADPAILGTTLLLNGAPHAVVGIQAPGMDRSGPLQADVWTALAPAPGASQDRGDRSYLVVGRLRPAVDHHEAATDLERIARALASDHPTTNAGWGVRVVSARDLTADARTILGILGLVAALVLLIACANAAGLLMARAASRRRDTAVRLALGASRSRILRESLTEDLVLALLAAGLGILLAHGGLGLVRNLIRDADPYLSGLAIDRPTLLFAASVAVAAPLLSGAMPALAALRKSSIADLKSSGHRGTVTARARGRRLLVVSQFAMAMAVLGVASLLVQTVLAIANIPLGFEPDRTLMLRVDLSGSRYDSPEAVARFTEEALDRIRQLPGVTAAGATTRVPIGDRETTGPFFIAGSESRSNEPQRAGRVIVSPGFLRAAGVPLLEGRDFGNGDGPSATPVALINRALAERHWSSRSPLGSRLELGSEATGAQAIEIVGVIGNVRSSDADQPPVPQIYLSLSQRPQRELALLVRGGTDPQLLVEPIRRVIANIDPDQALYDVETMRQVVSDDLATSSVLAGLLAGFGIVVLVLALTGLYGMLAWSVGQRTSEIGLRMALGARPRGILSQFLREGAFLVGVGIAIGLVGGLALGQLVRSELYGVGSTDLLTYVAVPALLGVVALLATLGPALRAMRLQPLVALRYE